MIESKKDDRVVIYGVTDRSNDPLWVQANDFLIDNTWVTTKEKAIFFQSLKLLVLSGIRIPKALSLLTDRAKNPKLKRVLRTITYDMNHRGLSLSNAFAKHPEVFKNSEVKMILSGEISGKLEQVLSYITTQIDKNLKLSTQIRSAMIYPITVFSAIFLAIIVIMIWVVPQFESLFESFGSNLPLSTRILINSSDFFQSYWWLMLTIIFAGSAFFQNWKNSPAGKYEWDKFVLNMPILKKMVQNYQTIQIATNFSTLLSSGVPVIKSLQVLRQIVNNAVTKEAIHGVENAVRSGDMLHQGFKNKAFDPILGEVIEIGEKSGSIQEILSKTGQQYELEFDADMQNLTKLLEPVILIIVASAIVFMGMAIMTPILELQDLFSAQ